MLLHFKMYGPIPLDKNMYVVFLKSAPTAKLYAIKEIVMMETSISDFHTVSTFNK